MFGRLAGEHGRAGRAEADDHDRGVVRAEIGQGMLEQLLRRHLWISLISHEIDCFLILRYIPQL